MKIVDIVMISIQKSLYFMLDPKHLRQDPDKVAFEAKRHHVVVDIAQFKLLEAQRKSLQEQTQTLQEKRNQLAKQVGVAKSKSQDVTGLLQESAGLGDALKQMASQLETLQQQLHNFQLHIPNILHDSVPTGKSEEDNVEIRKWGILRKFSFTPKDHVDLGAMNNMMDFEAAARVSGARF